VIEGYHGVVQTHAAAMAVTAMGSNAKHLAELVHGDLCDHAAFLRRHKAITAWQRKHKITVMQQHAGLEAKLDLSSACVWVCLACVHIDAESRCSKGKVVPRAVKGTPSEKKLPW